MRSKNKSLPQNISIKIQGKRITPSSHFKYLGIFVDEYLLWNYHVKELSNKLSRANGTISKLPHYTPKSAVLSVYYALFYSHMTYASLIWSLTSKGNLDQISILQKRCIRLIHFLQYNSHTSMLFAKDDLLKFDDIITSNKLKVALNYKLKALPDDLCNLFQLNSTVHSYCTRSVTNKGFFVPAIHSTSNGINTLKYSVPVTWNNFPISNTILCEIKHSPQLTYYYYYYYIFIIITIICMFVVVFGKIGQGKNGQGKIGQGKIGHGKFGHGKFGHGKFGHGKTGQGKTGQGKNK